MTARYPMGEPLLTLGVVGIPAPQGSKRIGRNRATGAAIVLEDNPRTRPWREDVRAAATQAWRQAWAGPVVGTDIRPPLDGPLAMDVVFTLPRPKSAPKTRVVYPDKRPDLDKLLRATCDALTSAGIYRDDAQLVDKHPIKSYPGGHPDALAGPGALIRIYRVGAVEAS